MVPRFQPGWLVPQATLFSVLHLLVANMCDLAAWSTWKRDRSPSYTQCLTFHICPGTNYQWSICITPMNVDIPWGRNQGTAVLCLRQVNGNKVESCPSCVKSWHPMVFAEDSRLHFHPHVFPLSHPPHSCTPATQASFFFPGPRSLTPSCTAICSNPSSFVTGSQLQLLLQASFLCHVGRLRFPEFCLPCTDHNHVLCV